MGSGVGSADADVVQFAGVAHGIGRTGRPATSAALILFLSVVSMSTMPTRSPTATPIADTGALASTRVKLASSRNVERTTPTLWIR